ncbi:MAG: toxin-antitoxin system HicB family antitoxin [Bacteroidetes bacterium]|nr:MAG: toxin-antitoxin system HicB family antitoxin [Bacteroidota bacterium]
MTDKLKHKEFIGSVHFSSEDDVFYGKVEGINDLVTFEGSTVQKLKSAFKEAVEDYVDLCESIGKQAFKSFKGSFNVRIKPELHSKAFERAVMEGKTLNQFVQESIEKNLKTA